MISSKHIGKITIILTLLAVILCVVLMNTSTFLKENLSKQGKQMEYEDKLFDTDNIISIDISMDASLWREMLDNAMSEQYYKCDISINGTEFYSVGIRPKGNTSLSSIANDPNNDRYSFKLEFDRFVDGQTCFGLDKLVLNNNYADTTAMKEAIIYDMYKFLDADAPLYNYAKISVNGNYFGVYLALEAVEDSFILRNYGLEDGHLYKPDGMNMGARDADNGGFGFGRGGGANLNYTDDNLENYSTIWNSAVNNSSTEDHKRVITALKNINQRNDIEKYLDIDNILKYMAVHNFSVNNDSLSGSMAHNYYLYESGGRINIIPWDYNLSFGGMGGSDATGMINDAIDDSYSSTTLFDVILEDEEYLKKYHEYYSLLTDEYFDGGIFDKNYNRIKKQIDELIKTDPNAMYSYDQFTEGSSILYKTIQLRAESVKGQLNGTIPSTSALQRENSESLIDASSIDVSAMGSFFGGRNNMPFGNFGNKTPNQMTEQKQGDIVQ